MRALNAARRVAVATRVLTSSLAMVGLFMAGTACVAAQDAAPTAAETASAEHALQALRRAWLDELDGLTATTRALAVADDAYTFVTRPNLPYVYAHYSRAQLTADRIDTVLIIDRRKKPLFWRRVNDRSNRGFSDAEVFLAQLPALMAPGTSGLPALAGAARIARDDTLVVAMPIHGADGSGESPGWLIVGRAIDDARWRRYGELAHVAADVTDPTTSALPADVGAAPMQPLTPVFRVEGGSIRGLMSVPDLNGHSFRVFSVLLAKPAVAPKPLASERPNRRPFWLAVAAILSIVAGATSLMMRRRVRAIGRTRTSVLAVDSTTSSPAYRVDDTAIRRGASEGALATRATPPSENPDSGPVRDLEPEITYSFDPSDPLLAPAAIIDAPGPPSPSDLAGSPESPAWPGLPDPPASSDPPDSPEDRLVERLQAIGAVFRYQPQIDLQTGRVGGVEALFCISAYSEDRPIGERIAEFDAAGLGVALAARWVREACVARQFWLRQVGYDFAISVPVSQATIEDPTFLPRVGRILTECGLAPRYLELQIPEAALGQSGVTRALAEAHAVGVLIAIDHFNAGHANLRGLATASISKLRVDPALVRHIGAETPEAVLFKGIVGASRGLGIALCANGVDSPELVAAIERHGCRLAQGTALGAPMDSDQFLELVRGSGVDTASLPTLELDDSTWQSDDAVALG